MAQVLALPFHKDRPYYRSATSPKCRSPQPSYTPPYDQSVPRSHLNTQLDIYGSYQSSPPPSSASSSPDLSSVVYSTQPSSSSSSSVSSSVCLDRDQDDSLFFPIYDFSGSASVPSPSPSPEPFRLNEDDDSSGTESPCRSSSPELLESAPLSSLPKPADDTCVKLEPSRHVDYLSHNWREEDIWASWRYIVGKRNVHSNAVRLENASWRTWAQKKNRLRTVSADKLNWMKDCDVTWLYGPLSIGVERLSARPPPSPAASPAEAKVQIHKTKPILKKRSMSEVMLQRSISTSSLLKQATAAIESQQSNHIYPTTRPAMVARANTDFSAFSRTSAARSMCDLTSVFSSGCQSPSTKKHIHFNNQVQQCIAVETDDDDDDDDDDMYGGTYDADDSSSDDGITMMVRSSSNRSNRSERGSFSETQTIAHLPSTTLKFKDEAVKKANGSFMSLNSFFASAKPTPAAATPKPTFSGTKSYLLDEDEDMSGLDWEPNTFAGRRDNIAAARPKFGNGGGLDTNSEVDNFQLPNFNSWEDDDSAEGGLFGRAVEAVNTARDIAHVLWNVGWRR